MQSLWKRANMVATPRVPDGESSSKQAGPRGVNVECVGCGQRSCRVVHTRYVQWAPGIGLACLRPVCLVSRCGYERRVPCGTSRSLKCLPCAVSYRRRMVRMIQSGLTKHAGRHLYFLTVSSPGNQQHRAFVPKTLYVPGMHRPQCPCHESMQSVAEWNPRAGQCWNRLRTGLRRLSPGLDFVRVAEIQNGTRRRDGVGRGAIHHHNILACDDVLDVVKVQELALAAGYGCVIDLVELDPSQGIDAYLTKTLGHKLGEYLTKASDERANTPWLADVADPDTGEIVKMHTMPTYRTHSESRAWGDTIKVIKQRNRDHAIRQAEIAAAIVHNEDSPADQPPGMPPIGAGSSP